MKRIGISTITDYNNYGNRLQNYGLQEVLRNLNLEVTTIVNTTHLNKKSRINYLMRNSPIETFLNIRSRLTKTNSPTKKYNKNRYKKFIEFTEENIKETDYSISELSIPQVLTTEFDFFVVGSDQVWNPYFRSGSSIDFLVYAPKEKRIAYAASFGIDEIPYRYKYNYKKWLSDMHKISVREESGAKIVEHLTGNKPPVLADPTLLLTKEKWLTVSKRASNRPEQPYLLTYFLGGPTDRTRRRLEKLANENQMTVINLGDITQKETYETGPSEFLDYINNASAFFTDSFHGVVFSIIFQTPFIVFERQSSGPSMYSRIETILDNFDMRDREANGFDKDVFSMDFSGTHEVLEREYNKSINYLKEALRIEE